MYTSPKATNSKMQHDFNMAPSKPDFSEINFTSCFDCNTTNEMASHKEGVISVPLFGSSAANSDDVLSNIQGSQIENDALTTPLKLRQVMIQSSNKRLIPVKNAKQFSPVRSFEIDAEVSSNDKSSQK